MTAQFSGLKLGRLDVPAWAEPLNGRELIFPEAQRDRHLYLSGATGCGKSRLLEAFIRQDIARWAQTAEGARPGLVVLDPHGALV